MKSKINYMLPEVCMELVMSGAVAHLKGDWTLAGVTQHSIRSLAASLEQIGSGSEKKLRIDCKQIGTFDISGLQFLYTWLQCLWIRGIEPVLFNLCEKLQKMFSDLGFRITSEQNFEFSRNQLLLTAPW
jgi:anti-anti-sigma regulatory factor